MTPTSSIIRSIVFESSVGIETIQFTSQTAQQSITDEKSSQGYRKKYHVEFKIPGINANNDAQVNRIKQTRVFYVIDAHNYETKIGSEYLPPKITIEQNTEGKAGGFRGYLVKIDWNSI